MEKTDENRKSLRELLDVLEKAQAAIDVAMKPFRDAQHAVDDARETILEHFDAEVFGSCELCSELILADDKYQPTGDAGPLCESCAATWGDALKQAEKSTDDDYDFPGDRQSVIDGAHAHVAAGGSLDDKPLYTAD